MNGAVDKTFLQKLFQWYKLYDKYFKLLSTSVFVFIIPYKLYEIVHNKFNTGQIIKT